MEEQAHVAHDDESMLLLLQEGVDSATSLTSDQPTSFPTKPLSIQRLSGANGGSASEGTRGAGGMLTTKIGMAIYTDQSDRYPQTCQTGLGDFVKMQI